MRFYNVVDHTFNAVIQNLDIAPRAQTDTTRRQTSNFFEVPVLSKVSLENQIRTAEYEKAIYFHLSREDKE